MDKEEKIDIEENEKDTKKESNEELAKAIIKRRGLK